MTEQEFQKELLSVFKEIGYTEYMIEEKNTYFSYNKEQPPHKAKAILYSSPIRKDSETAVIAIQDTKNVYNINLEKEVHPYKILGTPIIILAEYRKLKQETPPSIAIYNLREEKIETTKSAIDFQEYIREKRNQFSPRKLEDKKLEPFQGRLLFGEALKLTNQEIVEIFELGLENIFNKEMNEKYKIELYKYSLVLLGARILRDKANKDWSLESAQSLIEGAKSFNRNYFTIPDGILQKLNPLISDYLTKEFHFSHIGLETLGHFYERAVVLTKVRQEQGIYYTSPIIAKTILDRMPIEEIRPENRKLLDPTCGSGSFLVAAYQRFTEMAYRKENLNQRHARLISAIFGNDKDGIAADIAKLTLMLFHPPHNNNWKVSTIDALQDNFENSIIQKLGTRPTIIVGNLPFKKDTRNELDASSIILNHLFDLLDINGQMGIILPESFIDKTEKKEQAIIKRLIEEFEIYESFTIPSGNFQSAQKPAMAWILKKTKPIKKVFLSYDNIPTSNENKISIRQVDIFTHNETKRLLISIYKNLINKIWSNSLSINNFYQIESGFQLNSDKKIKEKAIIFEPNDKRIQQMEPNIYYWLETANNMHSFFNLKKLSTWVHLIDSNLNPRGIRKWRNQLSEYQTIVFLPVNTNRYIKPLIDIHTEDSFRIAPSYSYFTVFSLKEDSNYLYCLWILLQHPISCLYFYETKKKIWTNIDDYRNFPLPDSWNNVDTIKQLSTKAKMLLDLKCKYDSQEKNLLKLKEEILSIVKDVDKYIYTLYGFKDSEIKQIEEFFGNEKRPGLSELGEEWKQFAPSKSSKKKESFVDPNPIELEEFGTAFETLEVDYDRLRVKLSIMGLDEREDRTNIYNDGIWIPMIPNMPGWMLTLQASGWIHLKTHDSLLIQKYPKTYIHGFKLLKNAYESEDEIDKALFGTSELEKKKVG